LRIVRQNPIRAVRGSREPQEDLHTHRGKRNGSRTCLAFFFGRAGTQLGRDCSNFFNLSYAGALRAVRGRRQPQKDLHTHRGTARYILNYGTLNIFRTTEP